MTRALYATLHSGHEFLQLCRAKRSLIWVLAGREITDRFRGSMLGVGWVVLQPLIVMMFYVFIFSTIFRLRFPAAQQATSLPYEVYFIVGYLPWMTLQDILVRSCSSVQAQQNLVKQVVFPLEVLPIRSVMACFVPQLVGLGFVLVYLMLTTGGIPATALLAPVALLVQAVGIMGAAFLLSAVGVYLRDIREFMSLGVMIGYFMLPIIYPPQLVPPKFHLVLELNPLSHLIWMYHDMLFYGEITRPWSWVFSSILAVALFTLGFRVFGRLKPFFGNVL